MAKGHERVVKLLLEFGANPNLGDCRGRTTLILAIQRRNKKLVKLLLEYGADVNSHHFDKTPLSAAIKTGKKEILRIVLKKNPDLNTSYRFLHPFTGGPFRGTALTHACTITDLEIIKLLLENGTDINAEVIGFGTALHIASSEGHLEVVKLLIENRADVNARSTTRSRDGTFTALYQASRDGTFTALHQASRYGHIQIVKLLLENGALKENSKEFTSPNPWIYH